MVLRLTLTNDSGQPFALHHTVADLGGVTTGTAQEGMAADALADAAPMERLCAWVTTGQGQLETPLPVVLAVDGPEAVLSEGQTAVAYAYVLAPVEVADCQQVHLLADEAAIAYATFKK